MCAEQIFKFKMAERTVKLVNKNQDIINLNFNCIYLKNTCIYLISKITFIFIIYKKKINICKIQNF